MRKSVSSNGINRQLSAIPKFTADPRLLEEEDSGAELWTAECEGDKMGRQKRTLDLRRQTQDLCFKPHTKSMYHLYQHIQ